MRNLFLIFLTGLLLFSACSEDDSVDLTVGYITPGLEWEDDSQFLDQVLTGSKEFNISIDDTGSTFNESCGPNINCVAVYNSSMTNGEFYVEGFAVNDKHDVSSDFSMKIYRALSWPNWNVVILKGDKRYTGTFPDSQVTHPAPAEPFPTFTHNDGTTTTQYKVYTITFNIDTEIYNKNGDIITIINGSSITAMVY